MVEGGFERGKAYKCTFKGDLGESSITVVAQSTSMINCGEGPTKPISKDFNIETGTCTLVITQGSDNVPGNAASKVTYYVCGGDSKDFLVDCVSGCALNSNDPLGRSGQQAFTNPGISPSCTQ